MRISLAFAMPSVRRLLVFAWLLASTSPARADVEPAPGQCVERHAAAERARGGEDQRRLGDGDRAFDQKPRQQAADGERPRQRVRGDVGGDADGERAQRAAERAAQGEAIDRPIMAERAC